MWWPPGPRGPDPPMKAGWSKLGTLLYSLRIGLAKTEHGRCVRAVYIIDWSHWSIYWREHDNFLLGQARVDKLSNLPLAALSVHSSLRSSRGRYTQTHRSKDVQTRTHFLFTRTRLHIYARKHRRLRTRMHARRHKRTHASTLAYTTLPTVWAVVLSIQFSLHFVYYLSVTMPIRTL